MLYRRLSRLAILAMGIGALASAAHAAPGDQRETQEAQAAAAANADGSELEIASGADYSVGHYGAALDTSVWSIPLDLKFRKGGFRAQATLPYVFINGPGQLVGGVIVNNPGGTTTTARSGLGDLNLSAAYLITRERGLLPSIELGANIKLPTAKTTIGTGEVDYGATASVYKSLSKQVMLFGSVGYSWLTSPSAYALRNGITASGGLNFRPADNQNYGVSVAYREPVAPGLQAQAVVSPYMTYRVSPRFGLTFYGMAGLNNASPRLGAGIRLSLFP